MTKTDRMEQIKQAQVKLLEDVRLRLGLETLQTRNRDALDFHSLSVASIVDIVDIAFKAGASTALDNVMEIVNKSKPK